MNSDYDTSLENLFEEGDEKWSTKAIAFRLGEDVLVSPNIINTDDLPEEDVVDAKGEEAKTNADFKFETDAKGCPKEYNKIKDMLPSNHFNNIGRENQLWFDQFDFDLNNSDDTNAADDIEVTAEVDQGTEMFEKEDGEESEDESEEHTFDKYDTGYGLNDGGKDATTVAALGNHENDDAKKVLVSAVKRKSLKVFFLSSGMSSTQIKKYPNVVAAMKKPAVPPQRMSNNENKTKTKNPSKRGKKRKNNITPSSSSSLIKKQQQKKPKKNQKTKSCEKQQTPTPLQSKPSYGEFKTLPAKEKFSKKQLEFQQKYNIDVTLLHLKQSQPTDTVTGLYDTKDVDALFQGRYEDYLIQKGVIKVCDVKALIATWENFPNKATMPKELQQIDVPKKGKWSMSNTFTQREKQIIEEVYILLYGPSSGWDGKTNLSEIIALFLGGGRGAAQINSHLKNVRESELHKENKTGIRSTHPYMRFAKYSLKVFNNSIYQA